MISEARYPVIRNQVKRNELSIKMVYHNFFQQDSSISIEIDKIEKLLKNKYQLELV